MVARAIAGLRRAERRHQAALVEALPPSLDLCAVVLGSGGSIAEAVEALALAGPVIVREVASAALARASAGAGLDQALRWLQAELGPPFQPLTGALRLGYEQGGSIGVLLARLAGEATSARRRLGEERARRLPVALLAPLIVCSLPAVLLGAVVPLAIVALRDILR